MINPLETGLMFEKDIRGDKDYRYKPGESADLTRDGHRKLLCYVCRSVIADENERLSVAGGHTHYRLNPGGISYVIGCFCDASGCTEYGIPTDEHTWFAGYLWQVAACRQCGEHLGWLFTGADRFYGLINSRIIPAGE